VERIYCPEAKHEMSGAAHKIDQNLLEYERRKHPKTVGLEFPKSLPVQRFDGDIDHIEAATNKSLLFPHFSAWRHSPQSCF
jgi:regulatory protein YycH of two-component signal transduction system YycFG